MTDQLDLAPAARQMSQLVGGVHDDQLGDPTPCERYSVGDLLDHIVGLTLAFRHAAEKTAIPPPAPGEPTPSRPGFAARDNLAPDWRARIPRQLDELVAAWRQPSAWEGETEVGGVRLPAPVTAAVALDELVLHGWDLAQGTRQPFTCDEASTEAVFAFTAESARPGQETSRAGVFGPVVDVPADAPLFDRALGFSGRDPRWAVGSVHR
jgi:uncharacterized protein (TIGR03086 family)